ncbi:TonB-dependent receptor domain-containing protein [Azohydromonas australica]|uniref:TonB-dependent receptor domain-containing protein n=1 Tax=Azohydromonas australica TaxID=364039 RepID=UPI0004037046|nr:TonB-dependent receptor [Azohydromonas australica]
MKSASLRPAALCGLALLALTPIARAAEAVAQAPYNVAQAAVPVQPVVVTATRLSQPVSSALSDVRVIDAEQIHQAGSMSLPELLQTQAGVEIISNGGPGQTTGIFIRGANANHVLLLVDGVRINSATAGTNAFEHIPLSQIERVEVLRGPGSSLYGADAIGGVIQVFTKQGERTEARVGVGSDRLREISAGLGRRFGATSLSVQAGYTRTDAFSAASPTNTQGAFNPDDDRYRNRHISLGVEHELAADQALALRWLQSDAKTHFDGTPTTDDLNHQRLSRLSVESRNRITPNWRSTLRLARGTDDSVTTGAFPGRFRTDQDQLTWQNDLQALGGKVAAGLEWRREKVDTDSTFTRTQRHVAAVFGSYALAWQRQLLELSVRHDDDSQFGGHGTGKLAYGWQFDPAWRLSASAGTAFKAPTFNDLYFPLTDFSFPGFPYFYTGNPNLKPERARNVEAALRYERSGWRGGLVVFNNRIRDLIDQSTDAIDPTLHTVDNVARARIRGATLDAAYTTSAWNVRTEWTRQDAENADTGLRLQRRAKHYGSASLNWTPGPWRAGVELVTSGARFADEANTVASRMGGYALVNLHAGYALTPELRLSARLNNVADKRYELVQGFNTPGRKFFVALEYAAK